MNEHLVAADAALKAGRRGDAIDHLTAAISADPAQAVGAYRVLLTQLYLAGRYEDGASWSDMAVERHPKDAQIWNLRGVMMRKLKRLPEALTALDTATKLAPKDNSILVNRGNVLLDLGDGPRGEVVFSRLVRAEPRVSEHHRMLGRAFIRQGKREQGMVRFRQAVALKKDNVDAWMDILSLLIERQQMADAEETVEKALAAAPNDERLMESKVTVLRRSSQLRRAEAYMRSLLPILPDAAWLHYQLGGTISDYDRESGNVHMRRATELSDKLDYKMALIESLERTRSGDEGAHIEESYQLAKEALARKEEFTSSHYKIIYEVFIRVCAFDEMNLMGDMTMLGRKWAESGKHTALLKLLAQVREPQDRYELLEQHRTWGRLTETNAKLNPITRPAPRPPGGKIRLGFMSSDLRRHPVGYFALPLFENVDKERFELFCYSFYQGKTVDTVQQFMADASTAFHWNPELSARAAAQVIADDQLDILVELGGTTHMNKLDVMAYKPAPIQASWLGYPHSAGLETIDYLITDPYITPPKRDLLVEKPLMMPHTWLALGKMIFSEGHIIEPGLPQDRASGVITFGTANNPHKYTPELLALWARVLLAVPGSRFMFVRPEGGTASFRKNVLAEFEKAGVSSDRIVFSTIRGAHMPFYNQIDISLDTAPLTGGTTTTESLWMGVPVVSLVGEAFYERLSSSILTNSRLGDLATPDVDRYVQIAAELAADRARRLDIRQNLRGWMQNGPLGQTERFAADFYDLIARAVRPEVYGENVAA